MFKEHMTFLCIDLTIWQNVISRNADVRFTVRCEASRVQEREKPRATEQ
jgi:hypothetical protein